MNLGPVAAQAGQRAGIAFALGGVQLRFIAIAEPRLLRLAALLRRFWATSEVSGTVRDLGAVTTDAEGQAFAQTQRPP